MNLAVAHLCGIACWAGGCPISGIPAPDPARVKVDRHTDTNGGRLVTAQQRNVRSNHAHQLVAQMRIADAYDTVLRRYFWATWPEDTTGRVKYSAWDRAVVWRRLETGDSHAELGQHFGVGADVVKRILKRHELAAGWRGKKR